MIYYASQKHTRHDLVHWPEPLLTTAPPYLSISKPLATPPQPPRCRTCNGEKEQAGECSPPAHRRIGELPIRLPSTWSVARRASTVFLHAEVFLTWKESHNRITRCLPSSFAVWLCAYVHVCALHYNFVCRLRPPRKTYDIYYVFPETLTGPPQKYFFTIADSTQFALVNRKSIHRHSKHTVISKTQDVFRWEP